LDLGFGRHKASKGVIKVRTWAVRGKIERVEISGDFFMHPEDLLSDLQARLKGSTFNRSEVLARIRAFYSETSVLTPGAGPEDFAEAVILSLDEQD